MISGVKRTRNEISPDETEVPPEGIWEVYDERTGKLVHRGPPEWNVGTFNPGHVQREIDKLNQLAFDIDTIYKHDEFTPKLRFPGPYGEIQRIIDRRRMEEDFKNAAALVKYEKRMEQEETEARLNKLLRDREEITRRKIMFHAEDDPHYYWHPDKPYNKYETAWHKRGTEIRDTYGDKPEETLAALGIPMPALGKKGIIHNITWRAPEVTWYGKVDRIGPPDDPLFGLTERITQTMHSDVSHRDVRVPIDKVGLNARASFTQPFRSVLRVPHETLMKHL